MITVTTYIELPGTFTSEDDALQVILDTYDLRDWVAICEVTGKSAMGAYVDISDELGDLYYDPELQTILFTLEETEEREEVVEHWYEGEDGDYGYESELETHTVTVLRTRAASFVRKEQEDAP